MGAGAANAARAVSVAFGVGVAFVAGDELRPTPTCCLLSQPRKTANPKRKRRLLNVPAKAKNSCARRVYNHSLLLRPFQSKSSHPGRPDASFLRVFPKRRTQTVFIQQGRAPSNHDSQPAPAISLLCVETYLHSLRLLAAMIAINISRWL